MRIKEFSTHCFLISTTNLDGIITCCMNLALVVSLMRMAESLECSLLQISSCSKGRKTE